MEKAKPEWVKIKPEELRKIVVELAKKGETPAKIGLVLRDQHGIPKAKLVDKKISLILKEEKIKIQPEKARLEEHMNELNKHIHVHKHDYVAKRSLAKKLWILHKLQ